MSELAVRSDLVLPPDIEGGNPMPLDWNDKVPRMRELYEKAQEQRYNPITDLNWDALQPGDFTEEERLAVAYWAAIGGTFENSGAPTFARAMIASYSDHMGDDVSRMLLMITLDENNHDEICRRLVEKLWPGFPFDFEPKNDLERIAQNNHRWHSYTNSRYWDGYVSAFEKRRFPAITTAFILAEAVGTVAFMRMADQSEHPLFAEAYRYIAKDESRHFAFCQYLANKEFPTFDDEEKASMTKNLRASFDYFSVFLDTPRLPFWDLPDGFTDAHFYFEDIARKAGYGLPPLEERREISALAARRVKSLTDKFGFEFPALPEVGIEGVETPLTEEDFPVCIF